MALELYDDSIVMALAVADEIRAMSAIRKARRGPEIALMCDCADRLSPLIGSSIRVLNPPANSSEKFDVVLQQLADIDRANEVTSAADRVKRAKRHAGEAQSIVGAARVLQANQTTLLLTNDGGASLVAESHNVPARTLAHLLAELVCANPVLNPERVHADLISMTQSFGTLPADVRPINAQFYTCLAVAGSCERCGL
jgi:hypothetical protein